MSGAIQAIGWRQVAQLVVAIFAVAFLFGTAPLHAQDPANAPAEIEFRIGGGSETGAYTAFARDLASHFDGRLEAIVTQGSADNIGRVRRGDLNIAIAQNDTLYYTYSGRFGNERDTDLRAILPLFPEYIQIIVRADSGIAILSDLDGMRVNVGPADSGSYLNAADVLGEIGLRRDINFDASNLVTSDALDALASGEIDVVLFTGQLLDFEAYPSLRHLYLPTELIEDLTERWPYFGRTQALGQDGQLREHLSVMAYLFVSRSADPPNIREFLDTVIEAWPELEAQWPVLQPLERALERRPIPFHSAVPQALARADIVDPPSNNWLVPIMLWLLAAGMALLAVRYRTTYSRTGTRAIIDHRFRYLQLAVNAVADASSIIIGLTVFAVILILAIQGVRIAELQHIRQFNDVSVFIDMNLFEAVSWLFTYVASGFTENSAYPVSVIGRAIVNFLAILGFMGPISLVVLAINIAHQRRGKTLKGHGHIPPLKGHLLICGWNEKARGIIYNLTGDNVHTRKKIVVIADTEEESLIETYHFNQRYVVFCRGDSADLITLERAHARAADHAIVLADYADRNTQNLDAILTVMNLRNLNPDMYISAELAFRDNIDHFTACGANSLVTSDLLSAKCITLSTLSPFLIDFILSFTTFQKFDGLYSMSVSELNARCGVDLTMHPLRALTRNRLDNGINIVGVTSAHRSAAGYFDASFGSRQPMRALTRKEDRYRTLNSDDVLIYFANKKFDIANKVALSEDNEEQNGSFDSVGIPPPPPLRVLLYAEKQCAEEARASLTSLNRDTRVDVIDPDDHPFLTSSNIENVVAKDCEYDYVAVMSRTKQRNQAVSESDISSIDAKTVLFTRLIRHYLQRHQGRTPTMIAELLDIKNRRVFLNAGVDIVIPTTILLERLFVKEVFNKGRLLDFIVALMNVRDGIYLYSVEVKDGDQFSGKSYFDLLNSQIEGVRVLGWLPVTQRENLKNAHEDFSYYYRTVLDDRMQQVTILPGDEIIMTIDFDAFEGYRSGAATPGAPPRLEA